MKTEAEIKEKISYLEGYIGGMNFIHCKEFSDDKYKQYCRVYEQINSLKWVLDEIKDITQVGSE